MAFDPVNIAGLRRGPQFVPRPAPELHVNPDPVSPLPPTWEGYPSWFPCYGTYIDPRGDDFTSPVMCRLATSFDESLSSGVASWVTGNDAIGYTALSAYTPEPDWVLVSLRARASGTHQSPGCDTGTYGGAVDATRGCMPVPAWNPTQTLSCAGTTFTGHGFETVQGVVPNPSPAYTGDPTNDAEDCLFPYDDALGLSVVWDILAADGFHSLSTADTQYWVARTFYGGSPSSSSSLMAVL